MEFWDAYYADGTKTGGTLRRGQKLPEGIYHLVCEVLVRHADGDYLLMLRDPQKPNYGDVWEATAGGSALVGETPLECVRRELTEETGIEADSFEEFAVSRDERYHCLFHSYLAVVDVPKDCVKMQMGETVDYRWVSEAEFIAFVNSGSMIDTQYERYREYLQKIGYIK